MIVAVLRAITWGTVAAAVTSAVLLTASSGGMPRVASITGDLTRGRVPAAPSGAQAVTDTPAQRGVPADPGPTTAH
jgi:hypothetical protein